MYFLEEPSEIPFNSCLAALIGSNSCFIRGHHPFNLSPPKCGSPPARARVWCARRLFMLIASSCCQTLRLLAAGSLLQPLTRTAIAHERASLSRRSCSCCFSIIFYPPFPVPVRSQDTIRLHPCSNATFHRIGRSVCGSDHRFLEPFDIQDTKPDAFHIPLTFLSSVSLLIQRSKTLKSLSCERVSLMRA